MSTSTASQGWNLNRVLLLSAAATTLVAGFAEAAYDFAAFLAFLPRLVPALPGVIFAVVLAFYARPWVYLTAGILLSVLPLMVLFLFGAVEGLTEIAAGTSYQGLMLLVLTLAFALTGGIAGFVQERKGAHAPLRGALGTRQGRAMAFATTVALALALGSGMAASSVKSMTAGGGYDVVPDETVTLTMKDFVFSPTEVRVPAGKLVEIVLKNEDGALHTLTYEANGKTFNQQVLGKSESRVLVRFDGPQTVPFWCVPHSEGAGDTSDESMIGKIVVE